MRDDPEATPWSGQLPEFIAERFHIHENDSGSYDMLQVRCPRPDCVKCFWVEPAWATGSVGPAVKTRPCPHCFKTAWLPGHKPTRPEPAPNARRRVVKRRRK